MDSKAVSTYVGLLQPDGKAGRVVLDRPDPVIGREMAIAARDLHGAPFGMKVVVKLIGPDAEGKPYRGSIKEVLGDPGRPDVAILGIIRQYGLRDHFPEPVLAESAQYGVDPDQEMIRAEIAAGRRDLRHLHTITIDGEDARDLDDAVDIELLPDGRYKLGVHIADVSHYVCEGHPLDQEAIIRGTSVYLSDRVLPMLPPRLSNGICSLNPDVDRLTLSTILIINEAGEIEAGELVESVICSKARTSYNEVRNALETGEILENRYAGFLDDLKTMRLLAQHLESRRRQLGAIDFEFPETHVELDADGHPVAIYAYPISFANGIIESFMIAANEFVAELASKNKLPFVYRVHELPDPEKLQRFVRLSNQLGIRLRIKGAPTPGVLAQALEQIREEPFGQTLSQLLLRSLAKARYAPENLGHFGLALTDYCHFTSPIRRYPDLFIHRVLKAWLHDAVDNRHLKAEAIKVSEHSSDMERAAMQAERDSVDQKAAEYLSQHIGETFASVISGFSQVGLFVQLENTVEGMVPYRTLDGYYEYLEDRLCAINHQNGHQYHLGDVAKVQVARVDINMRRIDFEILEHTATSGQVVAGRPGQPGSNRNSRRKGAKGGRGGDRGANSAKGARTAKPVTYKKSTGGPKRGKSPVDRNNSRHHQ